MLSFVRENCADRVLEKKDLIVAVKELCPFLAQARVKIQKYLNFDGSPKQPLPPLRDDDGHVNKPPFHHLIAISPEGNEFDWVAELRQVATLVDTTLFRAYMLALPSLAGPLFRLDNFCDPGVVKERLYESGRYNDLIDFLHGKKLHREALELLARFGKSESDEVDASLQGPRRTVGYLQQLPPELIDLILEFADWPLRVDPHLGMEVFLADTENAEMLPRHKVLPFLERFSSELALKYLEHIINELNDLTPEFHQRLIDLYMDALKSGQTTSKVQDGETVRLGLISRFEAFLRGSGQYNRARVFRQLPSNGRSILELRADSTSDPHFLLQILTSMSRVRLCLAIWASISRPSRYMFIRCMIIREPKSLSPHSLNPKKRLTLFIATAPTYT